MTPVKDMIKNTAVEEFLYIVKSLCFLQPSMVVAGFLFTAGAVVMAAAPNLGCMFAGRVILGLGVGAGTMVRSDISHLWIPLW